jgi:two-component system KDP operon response regulator KdpE
MGRILGPALSAGGYELSHVETSWQALAEMARTRPKAVVLDLDLPDLDIQGVLKRARQFYRGPIIILAEPDREVERIAALDAGADDYVEKPFRIGEMLARLRTAVRRRQRRHERLPSMLRAGDLVIDLSRRLVTRAGEPVRLSPTEYDLLARLAQANGRVLLHKELLLSIWGPAHVDDTQYLRVFIGNLRQKIERNPAEPRLILTQPRIGYRFMADEAIRNRRV